MFYLHTSNQLEQLATQFTGVTNNPLSDIFASELVVVQNAGMARYLSMQVADLMGISANTEALFPAEFMWKLLRIVSSSVSKQSECSPDALRFHIMQELTENHADYPELQHYILKYADKGARLDEDATWALSCELSQLLDQYLFYRSDWIRSWEDQKEEGSINQSNWQARLWQRCVTDKKLTHWLTLQDQFKQSFDALDASKFPERISFFSMSALSPGYLDLLGELAKKTNVHLYIINPCENVYWGDISSEKSRSKLPLENQAYTDIGNPLLASMGTQGRDFIDQLLNISTLEKHPISYEKKNSDTLLSQLQNDIFNLKEPEVLPKESKTFHDNTSITFNACHTAMREVEVLHDQILEVLNTDSSLAPSDIVVMMPDIEKYAPYIEAIFDSAQQPYLPISIADRNPLNAFSIIEALSKVLLLSDTRFDVESVFELLDYQAIREQFNLDENQVIKCRKLAKSTNIRWGISASSRQKNDLPNTDEHTWKYALDRLLLGYTLGETADASEQLFNTGVNDDESNPNKNLPLLAYTDIEGSDAIMLANFNRFTKVIFKLSYWNHQSLLLTDWLEKIKTVISQLFIESNDNQLILKSLDDLNNKALLTEFKQKINSSVFHKILTDSLQKITGSEKYLGNGITFCALVPMRSVPFKIVALMGMNDGEFPRQDKRHSFDLMANEPRRGDRSRRDEDRYLFLESILATRKRLMISYTGQSVQDNSTLPPSVLVNELLDCLAVYTGRKPESFICNHPLQAFSPRYFDGNTDLFSYADEYLKLHSNLRSEEKHKSPSEIFIKDRLPELDDEFKTLTLDNLIKFYQNPARSFLQHRFSIQTFDEDLSLPIREPFELEFFKDRDVRELIVACDADDTSSSQLLARAKGLLPYGEIGDAIYNNEKQTVETFQAQLPEIHYLDPQNISLTLGKFQLQGELNHLTKTGRIVQQLTSPYFHDYIALWISHLVLNTQNISTTTFYSPDENFTLSAIENATQQLEKLLDYYWQGLHFPLNFFPKSAFEMYREQKGESKNKAASAWKGDNYKAGEQEKFENGLLYRTVNMSETDMNNEFLETSRSIFGEMYSCYQGL